MNTFQLFRIFFRAMLNVTCCSINNVRFMQHMRMGQGKKKKFKIYKRNEMGCLKLK